MTLRLPPAPAVLVILAIAATSTPEAGAARRFELGPKLKVLPGMMKQKPRARPSAGTGGSRVLVAPGANCSDFRVPDRPLCTLKRALAVADPGDSVELVGGAYPQLVLDRYVRSPAVRVVAARGTTPVLAGADIRSSEGVRLEGLKISDLSIFRNSTNMSVTNNDISPYDTIVLGGSGFTFADNRVHNLKIDRSRAPCAAFRCGYGIRLGGGVRDVLVRGNEFRHIPADAIQSIESRALTVEDNLFYDVNPYIDPTVHSDAIQLYGDTSDMTIRRNRFAYTRGVLASPNTQAPGRPGTHTNLVLENNVFVHQRDFAIRLVDAPGARVVNNTIWDAGYGLQLLDDVNAPGQMVDAVVLNNILPRWTAQRAAVAREDNNLIVAGPRWGPNDITGQPAFTAPERGDFSLSAGARGVDTASQSEAPPVDVLGRDRVGPPDVGAFETGAGSASFPEAAKPPTATMRRGLRD